MRGRSTILRPRTSSGREQRPRELRAGSRVGTETGRPNPGLRRAFSLGFPAGAIIVLIHWRGSRGGAANPVRAVAGAGAVIFCDWVGGRPSRGSASPRPACGGPVRACGGPVRVASSHFAKRRTSSSQFCNVADTIVSLEILEEARFLRSEASSTAPATFWL
jgi:hypothetical protein